MQVGESRIALIVGMIVMWLRNSEKFLMRSVRLGHGHGGAWHRGLEAQAEENHLPIWICATASASSGE